ncbi:hypothetical protein H6P81_018371 [Aristolochia fimbriata]|uniref:Reverse transcriptase n=1 Tax=Aristolochia fimbriata TaxID=158543 RepID=A0AAV7E3Y3_ARIFI|nr:hypothetical protein H6P81_018371 [Aristolochia fimbriata]
MVATCSTAPPESTASHDEGKRPVAECDDLETSLKQISPLNEIEDDLDLAIRSRQALIRVLDKPEELKAEIEMLLMRKHDLPKVGLTPPYRKEEENALSSPQLAKSEEALAVSCPPCITFREEDTQLGTKNHNRPLFVSGYIRDHKVNRILIDCGSAVNILLIRTMKNVGLSAGDLSPSSLLIQGHLITCSWVDRGSTITELCHPHDNGVVPSILHRCFKYWANDEQKTVYADESPFTEAEASFPDAKFYLTTRPTVKLSPWSNQASNAKSTPTQAASLKQPTQTAAPKQPAQAACPKQTTTQAVSPKQPAHNSRPALGCKSAATTPTPKQRSVPILRYIPQSQRKKGEAPLIVCHKIQPTPLPEKVTLPLPKLEERSIVKQLPSQQQLPSTRSNEGFDPNTYRLMARAGGNLTKDEIHAKPPVTLLLLTPKQEKLRNEGHRISQGRLGLSYENQKPIKIYTAQAKPAKITRKASTDVHQVSVGQTSMEKKEAPKPVVIYTLRAAIARARAYDSVMVNHISIADDNQEEEEFVLQEAPTSFEEGGQSTVDELKKVEYMLLLREYRDIFAWNYTEMPGLDPRVVVHKLAVHPSIGTVKQSQRGFRPELVPEIEKEVDKLITTNFIREVKYPSWISNIVPVKKKTGQIWVCVDFRNLNKACPKDDFPLPITELMVNATIGHEALSFMDGSSGYNQIWMDPKDEELTAFRTPKGIFCYKVMPFELKNAGATYQRAMQNIFDDFLHKRVECYVDNLVVKTKQRSGHLLDLKGVFERLRRFQLKMNPLKCAFGVTSGKFLGFIVHHRGIEIDQSKIDAIQKMPEPKNISELKSFQGHLAYIRPFISNLAGRCQAFSRLLKKDTPFEWDDSCRNAFNNIEAYLTKPPVLVAPIVDRPLLLYITAQEKSVGALLAQCDENNKERSPYYLSRPLVGAELNYSPIEKTCLALIFAIQKLRHYLLAHSTNLISRADPLKYIMSRPILSGRLAKWALLLSKPSSGELPGRPHGAGRMRINKGIPRRGNISGRSAPSLGDVHRRRRAKEWSWHRSPFRLTEEGFAAVFVRAHPKLFEQQSGVSSSPPRTRHSGRDAAAVVKHLRRLSIGHQAAHSFTPLRPSIREWASRRISRNCGQFGTVRPAAEPSPHLRTMGHPPPVEEETEEEQTEEIEESLPISVSQNQTENWREPITNFLRHGTLPVDLRERVQIRRAAPKYVFINDVLYWRSYEGLLLHCLSKEEGLQVLKVTHNGICGAHQAGPKLHLQVKRLGYYWPSMFKDAIEMARTCK